jgi:hypothetical protein
VPILVVRVVDNGMPFLEGGFLRFYANHSVHVLWLSSSSTTPAAFDVTLMSDMKPSGGGQISESKE